MIVCESESCLMKCRFCGKVVKPPDSCRGCGQESFVFVERGSLESYVARNVHSSVLIPRAVYDRFWIVERYNFNAHYLDRTKRIIYYASKKIPSEIVEKALDKIQAYYLLYPDLIPNIVETHMISADFKKDYTIHNYMVTYPVHQTIKNIANAYGITVLDLVTAFLIYVYGGV